MVALEDEGLKLYMSLLGIPKNANWARNFFWQFVKIWHQYDQDV